MENQIVTTEAISAIVNANSERIRSEIVESIIGQMKQQAGWEAESSIKKIVKEVIETEMQEDIKKIILAQKDAVLAAVQQAAIGIGAEIASILIQSARDNLAKSWTRSKVFKDLFDL